MLKYIIEQFGRTKTMEDNNSVCFQQFCNEKCAKVVFNFPPSPQKIPQGYLFDDQFHSKIEELGKQLLGFKNLIKYQLQTWQANQDGQQNSQQIHKWVCQFCYSYILYKFDVSQQKFLSFQYQLTHFHSLNHFQPYLIQDCNRFQLPFINQSYSLGRNREVNMKIKHTNQHNSQYGRKERGQINKLNPNIHQEDRGLGYRKQEEGADLLQRQIFRKEKNSKQIAWISETRKLINYIKPHRFQFPTLQNIPKQLNLDWSEAKIKQMFQQICESQKQMESEIWGIKIKILGSNLNKNQQKIRILCYCLSSLDQKCTYSLLYAKRNSDQAYFLQENQSTFMHHHIEQNVRQGETKMVGTWLAYQDYQEQRWNPYYRKQKNDVQYLRNVFPRVLLQRFQKQISLLLILSKESILKLLQMKYIFHTQSRDIKNYEQIQNQKLLLLQQKKMEDDILIIIHPFMSKLFTIYNRVLIIESQNLQQPFQIHKMYSIYCFKGISYMGSQIYYAICLIRDSKEDKIQIMLRMFMDKHQVIPNSILVSESDVLLYSTTMAFFQNNYPEIVLQTRQTIGSDYHKVLTKGRKNNDFNFMHFNIVQFQQKCIQEIPKQGLSEFSICTVFYHHNLIKRNSCLLQNAYFVGCDMNSAAHCLNQFEKGKFKKLQTNIFNAQSTFLSLAIRALKVNKQQKQKLLYPMQVQKAIRIHQLQSIRILMSRRPFSVFMLRVMKIPQLTVTVSEISQFYIVQSNYTSNIVTWNPSKKNPVLLCDCKIRQKTGMPCEHMIKIALMEDINLIQCIDKFWLVDSYAARHHSVDNSVEQMQKSKAGPIYVVKQSRKRPYSKLFHRQLVRRKADVSKSKEVCVSLGDNNKDRN